MALVRSLQPSHATKGLGLYIHIPFCRYACAYCDFYFTHSITRDGETFVTALIQEAKERCDFFIKLSDTLSERYRTKGVQTLYLGGGTPSLLKHELVTKLIHELKNIFHTPALTELTLEVNPEDLSHENLSAWAKAGVNRLSVGIQSFKREHSRYLGRRLRPHSEATWKSYFTSMRSLGFANISLDLIYGFPTLSLEAWKENLHFASELKPEHLSLYSLTIEPGTALAHAIAQNRKPAIDEATATKHFLAARDVLTPQGYVQYEISSFARDACYAQHNQNYWSGGAYLGLGPSAHSFDGWTTRWENAADLASYLEVLTTGKPVPRTKTQLTSQEHFNEMIIARLRSLAGLSLAEITTVFSSEWCEDLKTRAQAMVAEGLLSYSPESTTESVMGSRLVLTEQGTLFADRVMRHLLME